MIYIRNTLIILLSRNNICKDPSELLKNICLVVTIHHTKVSPQYPTSY